ncbi:MAG: hypothetical protein IKL08_03065 [Clostridia bacterium]|nr:hypothetical protein [Clostridia bacterium]
MKVGEFIDISKRMVKEYVNRYLIEDDSQKITKNEVVVMDFDETPDSYEILLTTIDMGELSYGVTYDKHEDKIHSRIHNLELEIHKTR